MNGTVFQSSYSYKLHQKENLFISDLKFNFNPHTHVNYIDNLMDKTVDVKNFNPHIHINYISKNTQI